jgi:hypothetical protein
VTVLRAHLLDQLRLQDLLVASSPNGMSFRRVT